MNQYSIDVKWVPINARAHYREVGPNCRGRGTDTQFSRQMPAPDNQRKGEKMLRIEAWTQKSVVICVCEECAPIVLAKFAAA